MSRRTKRTKRLGTIALTLVMLLGLLPAIAPEARAATEGDYDYILLEDKVTITSYNGEADDVVIPGIIAGYPVVAIGSWAFFNRGLTSVTIPDSVTHIRDEAFCSNRLLAISIGLGLTEAGRCDHHGARNGVFSQNPEFIVHCYEDSYAHRYLKEHYGNSQFFLKPLPTYTVTFMADGAVINTQTVRHSFNASSPLGPTKTAYVFNGWDKSFDNITKDITVNATWRDATYPVTFMDGGRVLYSQTVRDGYAATAPSRPSKPGYTFKGWSGSYSNITRPTIVTAKWTPKTITLTFKNGSKKSTVKNTYGKKIKLAKTPKKKGYKFQGWYTSKRGGMRVTKASPVPLKNATYYARWA